MPSTQNANQWISRSVTVVTVLLWIWVVIVAAQATWWFMTPPPATQQRPNVDVRSQSGDNQSVDLAKLQQLSIFGRQQAGTQSRGNSYANAPKTALNVRLVGVSASSRPERSAAIIEQAGKQSTYIVGDTIGRSRVTVEQILADRVILDNGGRLETLQLEDIGEDRPALSLVVESAEASEPEPTGNTSDALQRVQRDPGQLLDYVSIAPVLEQGSLQGYRLSPGNQADIFYQAGFQEGDLAIAINGYDLTDMQQASQLSSQLQEATEATVTVLRNGERIELSLQLPNQQE
ncbi:type II secretion system protein C (GspC) [Idiomarina fontislapidosi]|uniref:Type II secretion system protein GspC n=1 Tax=Idiomarina fontislapidosi TaxID=263723 RepID=A0A432Y251_9GAMM|nr:type II secretion system protein GspC [Idiomarina fontislapidosi]PYE33182.1 type II secretion system protein C (GspC) [Idiomarina fontislapidosi]RUO55028.1 type II secretion system protein GspC [Idiomarina fontislapidosi]